MERTFSNVSGLENLYPIKDKVAVWDFEKLKGIGFYRGHDKYCYLEICVYEFNNHSDTERQGIFLGTYIDWKVDKEIFPVGMYELYKDELLKYADFIAASFSLLIGRQVNLIFEINFSGYHPTDNWSKGACGKALINAVVSCFDENIYKQGLGHRTNHYSESKLSEIKRLTVSMDKAFPAKPKK